MKAAVYNRYWASMGGGERHAARLAMVLAEDGWQVDLLGPVDVGTDELATHLGLDLGRVRLRAEPERGDEDLARISEDYDLFVNASYMSRLAPRAKRNIYLCYFPTPADHDLSAAQRWILRRFGRQLARWSPPFVHGLGWYPPEGGRLRTWAWTSGDAVVVIPPGRAPVLSLELARIGRPEPVPVRIVDDAGREYATMPAGPRFARHTLRLDGSTERLALHLSSGTFVPGGGDDRTLGVAVSRLRVGDRGHPGQWLAFRFPWLLRDPGNRSFLGAYDQVLANSEYTRNWIRRLWDVDAAVLFPPVTLDPLPPATERSPVIASVGRFFGPRFGHSKRQLGMVGFFADLVRSGALPDDWRLTIVGGCEPAQEPYLAQVRAAASGLPVDVVANAPRSYVERLLATAAVFWSATGLGEDEERRPWTSEHFGLTTVEAMSGGCVPVVIDRAGQREIVRDGVDGYRWLTPDRLAARTVEVAGDPALRRRLAASARTRAQEFSEDAFAARWRAIAADLGL